MKKLQTLVVLLAIVSTCFAQVTFQETIGSSNIDFGISIKQVPDGGYVVTGTYSAPLASHSDLYLARFDFSGTLLWTKTYGGANSDQGRSIQVTSDGGYIILGNTASFGAGTYDFYLVKTDSDGNLTWAKTYGSSALDEGYFVQQTGDNGYILTGTVAGDIFLIKTDVNGDTLWTRAFGGSNIEAGRCVRQTSDGGYVVAGRTKSFGAGDDDFLLIKTNTAGFPLWAKTYGGSSTDGCNDVCQTADGGYVLAGQTFSFGAGIASAYLIRTDASGNVVWDKTFGGTGQEYALQVQQTSDGGFMLSGNTNSFGSGGQDFYLIRTDSNGDSVWTRAFGGVNHDYLSYGQQTADGGYVMVGGSLSFGSGNNDVFLIKTDSNGNTGCNEQSTSTIVNNPLTQTSNLPVLAGMFPIQVASHPVAADSAGTLITLCFDLNIHEPIHAIALSIFPNPAEESFTVSFDKEVANGQVELITMQGEKLLRESFHQVKTLEVDLHAVPNGIYSVKVFDGEQWRFRKLIVNRR